jgi:hypothetical protein
VALGLAVVDDAVWPGHVELAYGLQLQLGVKALECVRLCFMPEKEVGHRCLLRSDSPLQA